MSNVVFMRRLSKRVLDGTEKDMVVAWAPIPAGGTLKHLWLNMHAIGPALSVLFAAPYTLAGYVLPVFDSNSIGTDPDDFWDKVVPKDIASGVDIIDIEASAQDEDVVLDWLTVQANKIFGGGMAGIQPIFPPQSSFTSFADVGKGFIDATPDTYYPTFMKKFQVGKDIHAKDNSVALITIGQPSASSASWTDDRDEWAPNEDHEWTYLEYLADTILDASKRAVGVDHTADAGATLFGDEAMDVLFRSLEQVYIASGTGFGTVNWTTFTQTTFAIEVPGTRTVGPITSQ